LCLCKNININLHFAFLLFSFFCLSRVSYIQSSHPLDKLLGKGIFIVLKFIIEFNSLRDFWPLGDNRFFFVSYEDFLKDDILACVGIGD
jgi:hypothetical protein